MLFLGFESLIQSIDESDVSTSRREDKKLVAESDDLTEESAPSWTAAADSSLGAVPKRCSPSVPVRWALGSQ